MWAALAVARLALDANAPALPARPRRRLPVAAAITTGVYGYGVRTLFGAADGAWTAPGWPMVVTAAAGAIASAWLAARARAPTRRRRATCRAPDRPDPRHGRRAAAGGCPRRRSLAAGGPAGLDAGRLATLRTCVLPLSALVVAYLGSRPGFVEWSWLVYPLARRDRPEDGDAGLLRLAAVDPVRRPGPLRPRAHRRAAAAAARAAQAQAG